MVINSEAYPLLLWAWKCPPQEISFVGRRSVLLLWFTFFHSIEPLFIWNLVHPIKNLHLFFFLWKEKKNEWKKWAVQFSFPKYIFSHLALLSYYFCGYISTRPLWPEGKNYWASWRQKVLHVFTSRLFQNQNYLTGISFCPTLFYQQMKTRDKCIPGQKNIESHFTLDATIDFFCSQVSTFYLHNLTKKMVKSVR